MTSHEAALRTPEWLPAGKQAAVCFSVDDVHPGTSRDPYEAGGDLDRGALGLIAELLQRHPKLRVTLFVTADWREISPRPTRWIARLPWFRHRAYNAPVHPKGTMRLDRHPAFARYLRSLDRAEIALHGVYHLQKGPQIPVEFQQQNKNECLDLLREGMAIFRAAGLNLQLGMQPPGWNLPVPLAEALEELGFLWVASARDIVTPVSVQARTAMSGLRGASLIFPERVNAGGLVHFSSNFQATSVPERAFQIVDHGGLLAIKAHIVKNACGHVAFDGVDRLYCNYLDVLFSELERRFGDALWWTSMNEVAERIHAAESKPASVSAD